MRGPRTSGFPKGGIEQNKAQMAKHKLDFLYNILGQPCMHSPLSVSIRLMAKEHLLGYL